MLIRIWSNGGTPPAGWVSAENAESEEPMLFRGWLELLRILEELLQPGGGER